MSVQGPSHAGRRRSAALRVLLLLLAAAGSAGAADAPAAGDAIAARLSERARTLVGAGQGVRVETDSGEVWVSQAAERAVHPASVSKVPTTLALIRALGPEHRFETRFSYLPGRSPDLRVEAEGDPFLVDENAVLVVRALRAQGLERVPGRLRAEGPLFFDWEADGAARRLRRALAGRVPEAAWSAVRDAEGLAPGAPPALGFGSDAAGSAGPAAVLHRSQPLVPLLKALNGFSNNIFHPLSKRIGGVEAVERSARESVPQEMRDEIRITNAAGAGARNRLSPRAAVALYRALARELEVWSLALPDVLPVSGVDPGTLEARLDGPGERGHVVGKTGTYGDHGASALAGAIRSRDHGVVYFAVLNHDVPVPEARRRQDAFVRALLEAVPSAPWPYRRDTAPAFTRARVEAVPARGAAAR